MKQTNGLFRLTEKVRNPVREKIRERDARLRVVFGIIAPFPALCVAGNDREQPHAPAWWVELLIRRSRVRDPPRSLIPSWREVVDLLGVIAGGFNPGPVRRRALLTVC